jgi:hypothetical protein
MTERYSSLPFKNGQVSTALDNRQSDLAHMPDSTLPCSGQDVFVQHSKSVQQVSVQLTIFCHDHWSALHYFSEEQETFPYDRGKKVICRDREYADDGCKQGPVITDDGLNTHAAEQKDYDELEWALLTYGSAPDQAQNHKQNPINQRSPENRAH